MAGFGETMLQVHQGFRTFALAAVACAACASAPRGGAMSEQIRFVEGTAGRLRVSDGGRGEPAVLFVHGLGNDLEAWRVPLEHLRPHRRAVAYDQRGHGGSDRPRDGVYTVEALAADLEAVADALGLKRFVLVGHSLSGTVLSAYAGAHPERVAGLVYVDALGDFRAVPRPAIEEALRAESSPSFGAAEVRAAFAEMLGPAARPTTRERVLASVDRMEPRAFAALRRSGFYFEIGERLVAYRGPILAIEAEGEPNPIRASAVIAGAKRVGVPGVSHWLQLDDPAAFDRALDAFLVLPVR
jgi:pimeloyl-ACP methyl ester carboxylesterase